MKLYSDLLRAYARAALPPTAYAGKQDDIEAFLSELRERGGDSELTDAQFTARLQQLIESGTEELSGLLKQ